MLRELPYAQLREWMAYDRIEPIGDKRGDWQAASICAAVMDAVMIASGSEKRFSPDEFVLKFKDKSDKKEGEKAGPRRSWQEMKAIGMMYAAAGNSTKPNRQPRKKHWKVK